MNDVEKKKYRKRKEFKEEKKETVNINFLLTHVF